MTKLRLSAKLLVAVVILANAALTVSSQEANVWKVGMFCPPWRSTECMAGGLFNTNTPLFTGTYVCREERWWVFFKKNITRCAPTLAGAVVGELGDQCGCCGDECPKPCGCYCSNDPEPDVLLYKHNLFGKEKVCVSQGKASRWTADESGAEYSCVPESECPTIAPTSAPSVRVMMPVSVSRSSNETAGALP
jgi:hypothetical protein